MLESLDFLSKKSDIYINGNVRFTSWSGKIVSLLSISIMISIIGYFLSELISRKNFQVYENRISETLPVIDYTKLPVAATLGIMTGEFIPLNTYEVYSGLYEIKSDNGQVKTKITQGGKSSLCNDSNKNSYFNHTNNFLCMAPELNKTLYGEQGNIETGYSILNFNIHRCKNGTFYDEYGFLHNNSNCADNNTINTLLNQAHVSIEFLDTIITHLNYEPFSNRKFAINFPLSYSLYRDIYIKFQLVDYESDIGFVFEEISRNSSFRFLSAETIVNTRSLDSGLFASIKFTIFKEKISYSRKYMKFQVTLANIGGFTKFVISIAQFFVNFFSEKSYFLYLIDKFYYEENPTDLKNSNSNLNNHLKLKSNYNDKEKCIEQDKIIKKNDLIMNNTTNNNYFLTNNIHKQQEIPLNNLTINNFNDSTYSNKLKVKIQQNEKMEKIRNLYYIWDMIFVFLRRKNIKVQKLISAQIAIKKALSLNNILKLHLKLENLIDIVLTDDEKNTFEKIKLRKKL